ncbi:PREDICTED: leucine-rich repeat flightless-interacting protein 1 isoform X1 [Hipposideros armiger]|uniref:Leucine-rich repeat flightless-interacting protein 1 isoform X1 n=1 Tax=Hipposideros armiger TaxID=186990 RepID=A0A8B7Q8E8_HIPAR|nr:PREDICTED: leucine-rich repeat flightless-interacting protein 1 isoform X1 [Hipposideros armiger]
MTNPAATQSKEIDCLSPEAQKLAEARLAAKRAARAEAREIRMKELERQQKEIYQVQKKYYGLDTKWGDIEQWMEDSERYSRRPRRNTSASDEDERMSVGSRGSLRLQPDLESGGPYTWTNGYDAEFYGPQSLNRRSGRNSSYSGDSRSCTLSSSREEKLGLSCLDLGLPSGGLAHTVLSAQSGNRPYLCSSARPAGSYWASGFDDSSLGGARRGSACGSQVPSEHSGHLNSSSRASSRASSARASPVVEERPEKDFTEKGSRSLPGLSAATLASLGGTSSRRGSGDTSISIDTEASIREIKELNEIKDQIQDVEGRYMQGLKEMKDSLAEVEEKYKKAMVSNAQLDNEKTNFMYQVDTLKDTLLELEEQLAESRRQYEEKTKEFEREKHAHSLLQFQFAEVKAALRQREEMLEEIRQLQQKQASYIREISDLQETIEWKEKKIGALERQKEFFDSIRSERDDLREEVVMLKEEIKKHGIILNSEIATNGETPDTLNNVGYQGPTKMTKEELNALKATGDGTLGRAKEVEVKNEIVENVGKREILQNTEQEQHKADPVKDCVDTEVFHPGDNGEDQKTSEDSAPSLGTLANATNGEQIQSHILASTSFIEYTEQVGSNEVISTPGGASLEQPKPLGESGSEIPGPGIGQGTCNALEFKNQDGKSAKEPEQEKQDFKTNLGEVSTQPDEKSAPLLLSEVERVGSTDAGEPSGNPSQGMVEAELTGLGEQVGTEAPSPPRHNRDTESRDERCTAGVARELDPSPGRGSEKEFANQEAAEPGEAPVQSTGVGGENTKDEGAGRGLRGDKPIRTEVQTTPSCPAAKSSAQEAKGPSGVDAQAEPLGRKEHSEEKKNRQGEAPDSPHKKTKSKKKKNKKKKSAAPVETPTDVEKELTFQNQGEEEQVKSTDSKSGAETQHTAPKAPKQNVVAGSSENINCPGSPKIELDGRLDREDNHVTTEAGTVLAEGEPLPLEGTAVQAAGTGAGGDRVDEGVRKGGAAEEGATPGSPPEPGAEEVSHGALLGNGRPSMDVDSISLDSDDLAPAGELGDFNS